MIIYPAIDLQQGRVAYMPQNELQARTIVSDEPLAVARHWLAQGAEWLHLLNLDGASATTRVISLTPSLANDSQLPINLQVLKEIRQQSSVPIQYGGGLRSLESIQLAFECGADRVVLGKVAIDKPSLICESVKKWGADRIVVGLDARNGMIGAQGSSSSIDVVEMGHRIYAMGVRKVLFKECNGDGTSAEINAAICARLGDSTGLHVIASGNVTSLQTLELLKKHEYYNIDGVLLGKPLYTNSFNLREVVALGNAPLVRKSAGVVPYRWADNQLEVLLIYNYVSEQWQFPRGHIEEHESAESCAQREFAEQTSLPLFEFHPVPAIPLDFVRQFREYRVHRSVIYFLGEVAEGEVGLTNDNHCDAIWISPYEARLLIVEDGSEQLPVLEAAMRHLNIDLSE